MKAFLINLKRSVDRRNRAVPHLKERKVDFEIFDAVDGHQLTDEDMDRYCDMETVRKHPNWLTKGTIGACLSHYGIYKKVVEDNLDGVCVLEDDVVLNEDFAEVLKGLDPVMKQDKFVLLYYTSWAQIKLKPTGIKLAPGYELYKAADIEGLNSAAAYVISKELCRNMMNFVLPIRHGADSWTDFSKGGAIPEIYCVYPQPVHLAFAKSTIDYLKKDSLKSKVSDFINEHKIFPLYQIFKMRRKRLIDKMSDIKILNS